MKHKKILAMLLMLSLAAGFTACSKPVTMSSVSNSVPETSISESDATFETEETEDEAFSEFYSLENMSASEIKTVMEQYYTTIIPTEGTASEDFRKSLPVIPERIVNGSPKNKCFASYRGLDTNGHSRIVVITWEGFVEGDDDKFATAEVSDPKATFDIVLKDKNVALELLDLYRQEVSQTGYEQVDDRNDGNIYVLSASSNFVNQKATKTVSVQISPATTEGEDFWTVTVKHSYVK